MSKVYSASKNLSKTWQNWMIDNVKVILAQTFSFAPALLATREEKEKKTRRNSKETGKKRDNLQDGHS